MEEKFAASCDVASPLYKRRSLASSHCAGPAPISIVVRDIGTHFFRRAPLLIFLFMFYIFCSSARVD